MDFPPQMSFDVLWGVGESTLVCIKNSCIIIVIWYFREKSYPYYKLFTKKRKKKSSYVEKFNDTN